MVDTDAFSYLHENRPEATRFRPLIGSSLAVAFPTVAELHFGAMKDGWAPERVFRLEETLHAIRVLMPTDGLVRLCGTLRAEARQTGHPLAHRAHANDLWIATCAVYHEAPLVTGNLRHFKGFPRLVVLSPEPVR